MTYIGPPNIDLNTQWPNPTPTPPPAKKHVGRWFFGCLGILILVAVAAAGSGSESSTASPSIDSSSPSSYNTTTTSGYTTTTSSNTKETLFRLALDDSEYSSWYDASSDAKLINTGRNVCEFLAGGNSLSDVADVIIDVDAPSRSREAMAYLSGVAIGAFCPQYEE